jgi:capsular polysaccharide biosynthesis protein
MQLRNLVRRQKWRLRPLKRMVLPLRSLKRALVALRRKPPTIVQATDYRGPSLGSAQKIHPAWAVQPLPHPLRPATQAMSSSEAAWIFELRNIDFWGRYGGSVVTADNLLLADLSPEVWGVNNHPIFSQFRLPKARTLRGRTAIAVTPEAVGNYYHWLIDLLPRVSLLQKPDYHSYDRLLLNGNLALYEAASLQALGVPAAKITYVRATDRFRLEQATIPSMDHAAKVIAPWKIETLRGLRDSLPEKKSAGARRLYVSRKQAAVRRLVNEPDFEQLLRDKDFVSVELETRSWAEQVAMFAEAEVILAPHGAALANIAFCKPGAVVAEINTRAGYRDFYLQLAASAGLRYHLVEAQPRISAEASSIRAAENEDMIVDKNSLQNFLGSL